MTNYPLDIIKPNSGFTVAHKLIISSLKKNDTKEVSNSENFQMHVN